MYEHRLTSLRLLRPAAFALVALAIGGEILAAQEPASMVRLIVDYGDGVQKHFTALPWKDGMTVLDAMKAAQEHPRGVKLQYRGSGATAFLTQIDDVKNEGAGRNWVYRVNDQLADRGFGVFQLKAGDTVLWKFEKGR
jgi:hypothetical protein